MINKFLITCLISILSIFTSAHAIVAGGMIAHNYYFPQNTNGYDSFDIDIQITDEPGNNGYTFWANQFRFIAGDGGYTGLQQNENSRKIAIFSIWQATGWNKIAGTTCQNFAHEGSGVQCFLNYNWQEGVKYKFKIQKISANNYEQVWRSSVVNLSTNIATTVGEIKVPLSWQNLKPWLIHFVENFAQGSNQYASCSNVPTTISAIYKPKANNVSANNVTTRTYGNCQTIAESYCTNDMDCIASVKANSYINHQAFLLRNAVKNYCLDTLNGGNTAGLYYCQSNNGNQTMLTDNSYRLYLRNRDACLQPNSSGIISVAQCNNSSVQKWLPMGNTGQLYNMGTNKCMNAPTAGSLLGTVQVSTCSSNLYQKWALF